MCTEEGHTYNRFLVANHLLLSYVSFESAPAQAGLIPEREYTVTSACLARSRTLSNTTGHYRYVQLPQPYFGAIEEEFAAMGQTVTLSAKKKQSKMLCNRPS